MNRLLIGSSNVSMTYYPEKFKEYPPFKMIKCTKMEVFKAVMDDIREEKEVIIAVVENFLCDAVRSIPIPSTNLIDDALEATMKDYFGVIRHTAKRLTKTRFALAQPIMRPRNEWYTERYVGLCRSFVASVNASGLVNVSKLEAMPKISQTFVDDQVHLTLESSRAYVNGLLFNADALFTAEIIDIEEETSQRPERLSGEVASSKLEIEFEKNVRNLDKKLEDLNKEMFRRRFHDNLIMARMREELDTMSNINKEDKMVISGLTSKVVKPSGREEARKWLKDIVAEVLNFIEPVISSEIIFVSQGRSNNRDVPLAEVRMSSKEIALKLRKSFAQKKKAGQDFGRTYIANCVTLATRVRIEILKAMSKKFSTERDSMFVMGYASRPVLHVRSGEGGQRNLWLSFSDALLRYGSGIGEEDLGDAYRKAGVAFRGQLEQNFVVLHDTFEKPNKGTEPRAPGVLGAGIQGGSSTLVDGGLTAGGRGNIGGRFAEGLSFGTPKKRPREEVEKETGSKRNPADLLTL